MIIRKYKKSDAKAVARVISSTYSTFNKYEGTRSAVREYVMNYSPTKDIEILHAQFRKSPIHFVAEKNNKIIGMIRGRPGRIYNLFVLGSYHGVGIGKQLLDRFEKTAKQQGSNEIRIKASLHATRFYQRNGYKKTTGERSFMGLKIQPMIKRF